MLNVAWPHVIVAGRLYQVEYAMEAISHAGTCLGVLSQDGIVLAAENKNTSKLLEESSQSEKIYKLDKYGNLELLTPRHSSCLITSFLMLGVLPLSGIFCH
jgi:hypothetical protein